jgi:ABC-type sugar transport system ATPase subunit
MSTSAGSTPAEHPGAGNGSASGGMLLQLRGITKSFGPVRALSEVDLAVEAGKVTALVGDNGAGKSSLIKTVSGLWGPDDGEILWEGKPVHLHGPRDAEALGITTIYQDLALCDNLDIVQNMFLGHEPLSGGFLDEGTMETAARQTLRELNVTTVRSIRQPVASLSGGQRQSVAVAKAVMSHAQLVIMDEPTAALGVAQTRMVLDLIKTLSGRGVAVMVISHNLNDVFEVADSIACLYLGQLAVQGPASAFDRLNLVEYMTTGTATNPIGQAAGSEPGSQEAQS